MFTKRELEVIRDLAAENAVALAEGSPWLTEQIDVLDSILDKVGRSLGAPLANPEAQVITDTWNDNRYIQTKD